MDRGAARTEAFVVVDGARHPVPPRGLRVGRAPDNDVVLEDVNVSRQHLIVWATPSGVFLRDLGSQNGTYIGPRRAGAGPVELPPGATIRLGRSELRVEQRPAEPRPGTAPNGAIGRAPRRAGVLFGSILTVVLGLLALIGWATYRVATTDGAARQPAPAATSGTPGAAPASPATDAGQPPSGRDPGLVRALGGAVRLVVPIGPNQANAGSGTVITPRGHVLTNYHVVSEEATGRPINQGQGIVVAVPPSEGEATRPRFLARLVEADQQLDFALLRIVSAAGGGALPPDLGLTPVPVGDSDTVRIGDPLTIIGYPALGGQGVTVTRGIHSGLQTLPNEPGNFFKTDTEINPGNSGGTAIDAAGRLVGIPTAGRVSQSAPGKLGLVRPINLARPLIERANQDP